MCRAAECQRQSHPFPCHPHHLSSFRPFSSFLVSIRGAEMVSSSIFFLKPSTSPTSPLGFGTGHSCDFLLIMIFSSSDICTDELSSSELASVGLSVSRRRRLLRLPSAVISSSASANLTRGAGHGTMCGMLTTRKDTNRVVPKREVVRRDRG